MNSLYRIARNIPTQIVRNQIHSSHSRVLAVPKHLSNYDVVRYRYSARMNTCVVFVPQQEAWIIERMGKFQKILGMFSHSLLLVLF